MIKTLYTLTLLSTATLWAATDPSLPHLRKQGTATQLMVGGQPMLIRGGELNNSTATNPDYLRQFWPKLNALNLNTVVAPVYWDLIEPKENQFDFSTVDALLQQAREHKMRVVVLWFGSWKNSMSCYAPAWVKTDVARFPRAHDANGVPQEILSPFSSTNQDVDARAFAALMKHLRAVDGTDHTVILVQVENEIGMIPSARDHSPAATQAFQAPVPRRLMDYLVQHRETLAPELLATWTSQGGKTSGTWTDVFGNTPAAEEIFMAWYFAAFTEAVAAAGKAHYPLPMFANAALIRPGHQPGQYPSAGPLPHLIDVWRAAAPAVDFIAPDIYFENFIDWTRRYTRSGNPLFIPEALRTPEASVNGLYAFGEHDAIGFSPFGIEAIGDQAGKFLAASFDLIKQLEPLILKHQGDGSMVGLLSYGPEQKQPLQLHLGGFVLNVAFERGAPPSLADGFLVPTGAAPSTPPPSGGLLICTGPGEYVIAGAGLITTFQAAEGGKRAGILSAEEGRFHEGTWKNTLWLSGDQTHQGRHIRLEPGRFTIQRFKLYTY